MPHTHPGTPQQHSEHTTRVQRQPSTSTSAPPFSCRRLRCCRRLVAIVVRAALGAAPRLVLLEELSKCSESFCHPCPSGHHLRRTKGATGNEVSGRASRNRLAFAFRAARRAARWIGRGRKHCLAALLPRALLVSYHCVGRFRCSSCKRLQVCTRLLFAAAPPVPALAEGGRACCAALPPLLLTPARRRVRRCPWSSSWLAMLLLCACF
jgi:hypothetical protein